MFNPLSANMRSILQGDVTCSCGASYRQNH